MISLLLVATLIYFVSGKISDGIFLSSAIIIVDVISLFQDSGSRNALQKLKNRRNPTVKYTFPLSVSLQLPVILKTT